MKNIEVIQTFIKEEGRKKAKTQHLYIDTERKALVNYNTVIARWNGTDAQTKELEINVNYYSSTTSRIQANILRVVRYYRNMGKNFIVVLNGTEKRVEQFEKILKGINT